MLGVLFALFAFAVGAAGLGDLDGWGMYCPLSVFLAYLFLSFFEGGGRDGVGGFVERSVCVCVFRGSQGFEILLVGEGG